MGAAVGRAHDVPRHSRRDVRADRRGLRRDRGSHPARTLSAHSAHPERRSDRRARRTPADDAGSALQDAARRPAQATRPARRRRTRTRPREGHTMVDLTLTEQQRHIRELAHDFAEKEIRPVAWDYDRDATWPEDVIDRAWKVGLMNTQLPEEYGGAGATYLDGVLISEELAWGCAAVGTTLGVNDLAAAPVLLGGSEQIKAKYLGMLTEEPRLASFCLTEPEAGSDVSAMRTSAVRRGDKYVINGSKVFISNGGHADWYTVYAKTDREAGHRGISAFLVPRDDTVIIDKHEDKMGLRASDTAAITFNETEVAGGEPPRRREPRLQAGDDDARPHAPGRGGDGGRHRARRLRVRHRVLEGARAVRRADRDARGDPVHDRRHGHRHRGRAPARVAVGAAAGPGQAQHAAVVARQALRGRRRDAGRHGRRAGLRRLRVHQGLPGREADARRQDHAALRGDVPDPAARDRARGAHAPRGRRARRRASTGCGLRWTRAGRSS